jgi:hypothetical protein
MIAVKTRNARQGSTRRGILAIFVAEKKRNSLSFYGAKAQPQARQDTKPGPPPGLPATPGKPKKAAGYPTAFSGFAKLPKQTSESDYFR